MRHTRAWAGVALSILLCGGVSPSVQAAPVPELSAFSVASNPVRLQFADNGGSGELPEDQVGLPGERVVLPNTDLSVLLGPETWFFVGWAVSPGAALPDYRPGDVLTLQNDLTLYAIYSTGTCEITYLVDGRVRTEDVAVGTTPQAVPELPEGWVGWLNESGELVDPAETVIWGEQTFTALEHTILLLNRQDHSKYMDGVTDGLFHPEQPMTRAQAVQVLYNRLSEVPTERAYYADVPDGAWYAQAVQALGALGALDVPEGAAFQPDAPITRGAFAQIVSHFIPRADTAPAFSDVPAGDPAYEAICAAAEYGLFSGYPDGTFHPEASLTRAEATVVFNKLLHREPDTGTIATSPSIRLFPDVSTGHWAYANIMEATISHAYTTTPGYEVWTQVTAERSVLPDGYTRINGRLYRIQNGMFLRSTTVDGFTYDAEGRYTTGSASLDAQLNEIVETYTNDSMTRDQKLRALYNYVRDNFSYLKRNLISKGQTGWEPAYAEEFLRLGRGNCYSFSATFCLLARELGLPAYTVVGGLGASNSPHGWVEINLDGTVYMFDPQLEWRYLHDYGRSGYNLFKVLPSQARFRYVR